MENRLADRYTVRPAEQGHRIVDIWTGQTVKIAAVPQDDLSEDEALRTARMLNDRAAKSDRRIHE